MEKVNPIKDKSFAFALKILHFCRKLQAQKEYVISKQLLKSGTSVGANIEEAQYGQSRKDFISKMSIALKELHETHYWLRLIREGKVASATEINPLIENCMEIHRMLSSIVKTSKEHS